MWKSFIVTQNICLSAAHLWPIVECEKKKEACSISPDIIQQYNSSQFSKVAVKTLPLRKINEHRLTLNLKKADLECENEHQHRGQIQCGAGRWHGDSEAAVQAQSVQSTVWGAFTDQGVEDLHGKAFWAKCRDCGSFWSTIDAYMNSWRMLLLPLDKEKCRFFPVLHAFISNIINMWIRSYKQLNIEMHKQYINTY